MRCGSQNSPALPESRADLSVVVERHEPGAGGVVGVHAFVRFMDLGDVDAAILPMDLQGRRRKDERRRAKGEVRRRNDEGRRKKILVRV